MELFLDIEGYERYAVSTSGRVRNNLTGRILKPTLTSTGFYIVGLRKNNTSKTVALHKLVAERFIKNPNNYKHIIHKDGNKANNEIYNLEWSNLHQQDETTNIEQKYKNLLALVTKISNTLNNYILESDFKEHAL
jgi:hypothetical protein